MYRSYYRDYNSSYSDPYYDYNDYYEAYLDWLYSYYVYGPGSRSGGETSVNDEREEAPKEELAKQLKVVEADLQIESNTIVHSTSMYEITEGNADRAAMLVLRRGDFFEAWVKFDRPYDKDKHDMQLCFAFGDNPKASDDALFKFKLDESGKKKFKPKEWGANLIEKNDSDNSIRVKIHIPANCIVGKWELTIKTICIGKDKEGRDTKKEFTYDADMFIFILFNAWCKDDPCYMPVEKLLEEYVLNDSGVIYQGGAYSMYPKAWNYGQFELGILEAALHVMKLSFIAFPKDMANPIKVVRGISLMVNSSMGGVLMGNWSGEYDDGVAPWTWNGSTAILREYMETREPVRYGQCWVFAAITTTVLRALGLAARPITNFQSAHDTERSNTIDKFFDKEGEETHYKRSNDSTWNFHVWNEVWIARSDLENRRYDGWQALDSTPQEATAEDDYFYGVSACGPCPILAVKRGDVDKNFDCDFVFSEVNADEIHWQVNPDNTLTVLDILERSVGLRISTKKPDGGPYPPEDYDAERHRYRDIGEECRLDVTNQYKFPEGSHEERDAVHNAHAKAEHPRSGAYNARKFKQAVRFKLLVNDKVTIGSDLEINVRARNKTKELRVIRKVVIKVYPKLYTGEVRKFFFNKTFSKIDLKPGQEEIVGVKLTEDDYFKHLLEKNNLQIDAYIEVEATATEEEQHTIKTHQFQFQMPGLHIKGPRRNKVATTIEYEVKFKNPLHRALTNCVLMAESTAFKRIVKEKLPDVPAKGELVYKLKCDVKEKLKKPAHSIIFELDANELYDITDGLTAAFSAQ